MAFSGIKERYQARDADYFNAHYPYLIMAIMAIILLVMIATLFLIYQLQHRPVPVFYARTANGEERLLTAYQEPNLLPQTIISFASRGATTAYTFSFDNIAANLALTRPYFTEAGWAAYRASVNGLINNVVANQLFVNSIVYGTPIISNQGVLPDKGYTWRVQIPFLVAYESANSSTTQKYYVIVTIVKVPTYLNPRGIGIDEFVMTTG